MNTAPVTLVVPDGLIAILTFAIGGVLFLSIALLAGRVLRPHNPNAEKNAPYESGEEAQGFAHGRYNIRFYVVALLFLLFDVEVVLLYPWLTVYGDVALNQATNKVWGWLGLAEGIIFILVLSLGLVYAWAKGYLVWDKPMQNSREIDNPLPTDLYQTFNNRQGGK